MAASTGGADIFAELSEVNAEAPGFVAWAHDAEWGARWGARVARVATGTIEIARITGTYTDTTERSLAAAAAVAVWNAIGCEPDEDARRHAEEIGTGNGPLPAVAS